MAAIALASTGRAQSVTGVQATQLTDRTVEILYDLAGAPAAGATVSVAFSQTGGEPYGISPAAGTVTGDVGVEVANGTNKRIVWNAAATLPAGTFGTKFRAAVTATACVVTCDATAASTAAAGQAVSFEATANAIGCDADLVYQWSFGDGSGVTQGQSSSHALSLIHI